MAKANVVSSPAAFVGNLVKVSVAFDAKDSTNSLDKAYSSDLESRASVISTLCSSYCFLSCSSRFSASFEASSHISLTSLTFRSSPLNCSLKRLCVAGVVMYTGFLPFWDA